MTFVVGAREWRYEEPGWRPVALGVAAEVPYLWSARSLVVLPVDSADEPEVLRVDEDLLLVFRVEAGWLLVCETSIRLVVDGHESSRVEIGEVVEHATWNGGELTVHDARGRECRIRVDETRLTITGNAADGLNH
ncbi:hypothetical protein [Amycolatopsis sp.]|uniref:hypothetical protein n=1 Tax=Amycolatopsis sp. TaxID=37632 RepID=UPI002DF9C885|nr:hypothetical protein [Amycolatopsis sp.]